MTEHTREWYLRAARELAATSSRQVEWCAGVADDPRMLELLERVPRPARQPSLLFAVAAHLGAPDAPYGEWADAVLARADALVEELPRRRVQTNEPGRCVPLVVALDRIPGPLALVELGASAGLCLIPERYRYRLRTPDGVVELGSGSPLLEAETDAAPRALPEIVWRRGIDLAPVDPRDPGAVRWLEASLPPDRPARRARLRAALTTARTAPPTIVAGDALATLPDVASAAPADATLVVASLGTAVYLPPDDRSRMLELIAAIGARAVTFEARPAIPAIARRWDALVAEGDADADAGFLLAIDGEPVASGSPHGDRCGRGKRRGAAGRAGERTSRS